MSKFGWFISSPAATLDLDFSWPKTCTVGFLGVCRLDEPFSTWITDRIPAYLDGRRADLEALHRALQENDLAGIQDIAHKMKGTGASYGFGEITEIGSRMEAAVKAANRAEIEACIAALHDWLNSIRTMRADLDDRTESDVTARNADRIDNSHFERRHN